MEGAVLLNKQTGVAVNKRNYGIDLLRILSMLFVIIIHILGHNDNLAVQKEGTAGFFVMWGIDAFVICAVNVFAMISGYGCYGTKFTLKRVFKFWLEVFFYSVVIYVACSLYTKTFSVKIFIERFFPIVTGRYWYFTAYFIVMLLMPLFNIVIEKMNKTTHFIMLLTIFVLSIPTMIFNDLWQSSLGRSTIWLCCLYFFGAYFRKYGFVSIKKWILLLIYVVASLLILVSKILIMKITENQKYTDMFYSFTSILVIIQALALINIFGKFDINNKPFIGFIKFFAPLTFGIYLIHETFELRELIFPKFIFISNQSVWLYIPLVIAVALAVFLACALVDYLRQLLFKYCRINKLCDKVGDGIQTKFYNFIDKKLNKKKEVEETSSEDKKE